MLPRRLLPLASSLLIGAAFWVEPLWFFIGIAFIPLFFAFDQARSGRDVFLQALSFVLAASLIVGYPLLSFRSVQGVVPVGSHIYLITAVILVYLLSMALLAAFALWLPLAFPGLSAQAGLSRAWRIFSMPLAWVAFEVVKTKASFGLQWIFIGEPLIEFAPLAIFARFGGTYALSFFVLGFNIALYESTRFFLRRRPARRALLPLSAVLAFTFALVLAGFWYTRFVDPALKQNTDGRELKVAIIQPGSAAGWEERGDFFDDLHRRTREALRPEDMAGADLLIFPGDYFRNITREDLGKRNLAAEVLGFAPEVTSVLIGSALPEGDKRYQALTLQTRGSNPQITLKEMLLPLSDFVPKFLKPIYPAPKDLSGRYASGEKHVLVALAGGFKIGAIACNEEFVPGLAARLKKEGAGLLIVSGSIDDFASATAYREALRAARFRALENGFFVIQAMKNGVSAIIDPQGKVIQSLDKDQKGVLIGIIPL